MNKNLDKNKVIYHVKNTLYLVLDKNNAYLVDYKLAKLPSILDYVAYTLIVVSALLVMFNRYVVSAYLFIAASVIILFSYYLFKIFIRSKIKKLSQKQTPSNILLVQAKQGIRSFEVNFYLKNGVQQNIKVVLSYKSFLELQKMLKANNIVLKLQK